MDWWPEGRFGCPRGVSLPVRPRPLASVLAGQGMCEVRRPAGRQAGRQACRRAGRQAAAAGRQQRLSSRRLRSAPARDGRASRAATKVARARVPRLAHLVLQAVPAACRWAQQLLWWCCGARLRSARGCAAARGCAQAAPPVVAARRLHWAAASGRRHWRQPLALLAHVARRRGTYVQSF